MILIFGGTTEGKKVAELFDVVGQEYWYSTKTDAHKSIKGRRVFGEMNFSGIAEFCREKNIRLIVDAAHPFAVELHKNIYKVSCNFGIEVVRYERNYPVPEKTELIRYFSSYDDIVNAVLENRFENVLALTGVQTIEKLQKLSQQRSCYFRILDTKLSREKAKETGIKEEFVIPMKPKANANDLIQLANKLKIDILLSKESGESGFFETKVKVAQALNIPLWVIQRPVLPGFKNVVDGGKEFLQQFYLLKKTVLKEDGNLRSGYTTGTCVTAAAKACFIALVERKFPGSVQVELPDGERANFVIFPKELRADKASCVVIKDAGDDPDVTHAKEIGCELTFTEEQDICFLKGKGVGVVTLPGLQVPVGEPAINPVPRKMITGMLGQLASECGLERGFKVKPFVPEGEELASQTFNPRIGVIDGISILGTTGKVMPYSNESFLASIQQQIKVAKKNGCNEVVLTSGKRSENRLREYFPNLPAIAFIHFGNLVGETIKLANEEGIDKINLGIMFGKAMKLAEGHLDTHSKKVVFNPEFAANVAKECGYPNTIISAMKELKLANAIVDLIPFDEDGLFYNYVVNMCRKTCLKLLPDRHKFNLFLLVGSNGVLKSGDY